MKLERDLNHFDLKLLVQDKASNHSELILSCLEENPGNAFGNPFGNDDYFFSYPLFGGE